MMYNSLDRLLDGLAATLRDEVAAHVDDPYVRAQAHAAAELITHLAEHVEWRCDQLRTEIDAAHAALRLDSAPASTITDNHELVATHDALLLAIADAQRSSAAEDDAAAIDEFVRHYHGNELDRFTAARYRTRR
ncbi:MAG: hypothetical protein ABI658_02670 [Acidimicrobiales bacterium]